MSGEKRIDESNLKSYDFIVPSKQVLTAEKVKVWEESEAYQEYLGFILAIGDSIKARTTSEDTEVSVGVGGVIKILNKLDTFVDQNPPLDMQARYGNPAYRDWFEKLESSAHQLIQDILPEHLNSAKVELAPYLIDSFGNKTRIDYGTGHEMTFVMFVCALFKIGFLVDSDRTAVGLKLFTAYFDLARRLQTTYRMEPAGSMGVWNLDDFQFVAFIFGAAQLSEGARIKPKSIADEAMAEMLKKDYHIFACLSYINQVKTGPFHEHSNQLWNISAVQLWSKVYSGLIKMYRAEVLSKFPVIQHTLFGSIFTLEKATKVRDIPGDDASTSCCSMPPGMIRPGFTPRTGAMPGSMPLPGSMPMFGSMPLPGSTSMPGSLPSPGSMPLPGSMPKPGAMPRL